MKKTLAWFPSQCAMNSIPVMAAVTTSTEKFGIELVKNSQDADAAVIWSVLWYGRMRANQGVYEHYRSQNRPIIVIDVGSLHRGHTWKIAVNNINAQGYYGHHTNLDWDRPRKLGINLQHNSENSGLILLAAQHHHSLQLSNVPSQEAWIADTVIKLKNYTDRHIIIRPHPRSLLKQEHLPPGIELQPTFKMPGTYDNFDINYQHHAVVNYCSSPGIQAGIQGTRPITHSTSLAHPVSVDIANIEKPYVVDRSQWLIEITHTEYLIDEIAQGIWLQRLENKLPWPL